MCYDRATYVVRCSYVFIRSTPTQGATNHIRLLSKKHSFNPRVHAGCDAYTLLSVVALIVSTHAPTKGATLGNYYHLKSVEFQPTRPRRARRNCSHRALRQSLFQPTRPRRARPRPVLLSAMDGVSTHTPTKGATVFVRPTLANRLFQPTRPRRARLALAKDGHKVIMFQPTRPRRARLNGSFFNAHGKVSTHTPTKGATVSDSFTLKMMRFQPTRPRRARHYSGIFCC